MIKQGHNTLTITLPSKWAKRFNLSPGDEIELIERDSGLYLTTERKSKKKVAKLDLRGMDIPTIWKYFMAVYRAGFDEVIVLNNISKKLESPYKYFASNRKLDPKYSRLKEKKTLIEFLYDLLNRFIGYEIIYHNNEKILIKEISEVTPKEFDNSLRRIFLLILQMVEEVSESLVKKDIKKLEHIHDLDINLDKFQDYCIRILTKKLNKDSTESNLYFSLLLFLELIGDEYKNVSHHLLYDFNSTDFENLIDIADSIKQQLELFYEIFYKYDEKKLLLISEIDRQRYFNVQEKYKKTRSAQEKEIFHHLRIITRYINALLEILIELRVCKDNF